MLLRAGLNAPIDRLADVSSVVYYLAAASCLPAVTAARRHIAITPLENVLPPRANAALAAFGALLAALLFGLLAWQMGLTTREMALNNRTLPQIPVPEWPFWSAVTLLLAYTFVIQLTIAALHARRAIVRTG